jgi:hypothetical protein
MPFQVPKLHVEILREFLALSDGMIDGFISALVTARPQFNFSDLASEVPETGVPRNLTEGILHVVVSLYRTGSSLGGGDPFLDNEVFPSLVNSGLFPPGDGGIEWQKLRRFLAAALSLERSVGTASKAGPVLTDHERIFDSAKILTDLRPVYHLDVSEKPDAAVIIHMLKITQRDQRGNKADLFFALDSNDIATMKEIIALAEKKEQSLRGVVENSGITVLNVRSTY